MKTAITLSLLPNHPKMPFVLGPDLELGFQQASQIGFDAVELFPPSLEAIDAARIDELCRRYQIDLSTIGTGGGAVAQGLTLTHEDSEIRDRGRKYVRQIIQIAGDLGASAIIGSMQGKAEQREPAGVLNMLGDALGELGDYAARWQRPVFFEPLNRYESDLVNTLDDAKRLIESSRASHVKILADLFHMNIEESQLGTAIMQSGALIGHVHFVDSNRQAAGRGHLEFEPVVSALRQIGFTDYCAVEAFPRPNPLAAAEQAMAAFKQWRVD